MPVTSTVNGVDLLPIEPSGSRRLSSWTNFDLLVAQRIPMGPANVRIEARLLNVFNSQPALTVNQDFCNSSPCTAAPALIPIKFERLLVNDSSRERAMCRSLR